MAADDCKVCRESVTARCSGVVCEVCDCWLHTACVGLKASSKMLSHKNIVFLCDECLEEAKERMKDRKEDKLDQTTQTMTAETRNKDVQTEDAEARGSHSQLKQGLSHPSENTRDVIILGPTEETLCSRGKEFEIGAAVHISPFLPIFLRLDYFLYITKMPSHCCVPRCDGNYRNGPKVTVFSFPKDEELGKKWLRAIRRDDFTPTESSRVCELHFIPEDIERDTSYIDQRTGRKLTAKLRIPRLRPGAVPTLMPNCPSYLSRPHTTRESPEGKRCRKEQDALSSAITQSILEDAHRQETRKFASVEELATKLVNLERYWNVIKQENSLIICKIYKNPHPSIALSVLIDNNCAVKVYVGGIEMHKLGKYSIPSNVTNMDSVEELLDNLRKCDTE